MAEWRSRGYVSDSDEEDESQGSEKRAAIAPEEGFQDIDVLCGTNGDQLEKKTRKNELRSSKFSGGLGGGNGAKCIGSPFQGVEKEHPRGAVKANNHSPETLRNTIDQEPVHSVGLSGLSEDIDELQQDHYPDTPVAQLETKHIHLHNEGFYSKTPSEPFQQAVRPLSSSPLSEPLPSSPRDSLGVAQWQSPLRAQGNRKDVQLQPVSINQEVPRPLDQASNLDPPSQDNKIGHHRAGRSLRHRNPIQLHPYAIESEKYRQILKARGVKPLRITQIEVNLACAKKQDTQEQDFDGGDGSQLLDHDVALDDLVTCSSPFAHNPTLSPAQELSDIFQHEGDELPDLDSLLRQPRQHITNHSNKRRKTMHTFSKKEKRRTVQQDLNLPISPSHMHPVDDDSMFDVPPSPPQSGSPTPIHGSKHPKDVFRVPRGLSPSALPTPTTSSEPREHRPTELFNDSESCDDAGIAPTDGEPSADSELSNSSSESEGDSQLKRVQRKIKGVLPASWLKLDLRANPKKSDDTSRISRNTSPAVSDHLGVARPVTGLNCRSPNAPGGSRSSIEISEDEESDLEPTRPTSAAISKQCYPGFDIRHGLNEQRFSIANNGEVKEDNRFDAMLPSDKKSASHPRKYKRKSQTTLKNAAPRSSRAAGNLALKSSKNTASHPITTDRLENNRKKTPKFRVPRLSILDVSTRNQFSQEGTPQFLKVASRMARSRKDRGRHSPSRKFLRLATDDDTNDADETLRRWRDGTLTNTLRILEKNHLKEYHRKPLYPRSHNLQLSQIQFSGEGTEIEVPQFSYKARPVRYPSNSKKLRMIQRSLDDLVQRSSTPQIQPRSDHQQVKQGRVKLSVKKRGQMLSPLQTNWGSRPALLESLQEEEDQLHRVSAFKRDLTRIDKNQNSARAPNELLEMLFRKTRPSLGPMGNRRDLSKSYGVTAMDAQDNPKLLSRRRKKRQPHRIDIETSSTGQASAPLLVGDGFDPSVVVAIDDAQEQVLIGLGAFGTHYTVDFDVKPLSKGTCFHESTFLGSGEFLKSLDFIRTNDLDRHRGYMSLCFASRAYRWGPWNDKMSGQLVQIFDILCRDLRLASAHDEKEYGEASFEQIISFLRNVIRYLSDHQSFLDPVDRNSHLQRWKDLVVMVFRELDGGVPSKSTNFSAHDTKLRNFQLQLGTLLLVIANQLRQISEHHLVQSGCKNDLKSLILRIAQQSLTQALGQNFDNFRKLLENLKPLESSAYTIRENHHPIETLIIAQHVLGASTGSTVAFWEITNEQILIQNSAKIKDVRIFEIQWQKLYTLLPFLEFDEQGITVSGQRFRKSLDNWIPVKRMISQVLEVYMSNARAMPPNYNGYCRTLYSRCFCLINGWGWQRSESVIGILFDFFARNNLAHLKNEESYGSAPFLEHLDQQRSLEISSHDKCFHILLKIIGSGLKGMRQIYPEKKIRDVIWRLMPNHGRFHPKEETIRQEDLDALRNHHDLLCTLYWAAPPSFRPRLSVIRNLVHLESSHREACHISIKAWSNLARFQLSTPEPLSSLKPFAEWHSGLLEQILHQHTLARTEAEEQVKSTYHSNGLTISKDLLESTIVKNQRQVEAILNDALTSLRRAINDARTREAAGALMTPIMTQVFLVFDAKRPQISRSVIEALDVLLAYVSHCSKPSDSQDSQDYGDWSGFDDDLEVVEKDADSLPNQVAKRLEEDFHGPLRQLLSNCFGSDTAPRDVLLTKLVDVWVAVALCLVHHGTKSWSDYIDRFGHDSWTSLRDTEQTRKFTTYFLAALVDIDNEVYQDNKPLFIIAWIKSLVERESMLKFQHRLTSSLLNTYRGDPLMRNLPFSTNKSTDRFELTATEFSQRRLSLISTLLSNMRESVDEALYTLSTNAPILKQDYKELLKYLMLTMKQRYQELGSGVSIQGAYVDFVHRVIEFLQQHTSTICSIDRFFMDSAAFPLPATDPTYVVGQLKNYGLRLQDSRTPKQLAVFLQSVSERAVVDGQQEYLVGQMYAALTGAFEHGEAKRPTLRFFVVKAIIPAYVEVAFSTTTGWLLALPLLQALEKVFRELLTDLDGTNPSSVTAVLSTITVFLDCLRHSFTLVVDHSGLLDQPKIIRTLAVCYSAVTATLPILDYVTRLSGPSVHAVAYVDFFRHFATFAMEVLQGRSDVTSPNTNDFGPVTPDREYAEVRKFALHELRETLNKNWVCHEEQYHMVRGQSRKEVMADVGTYAEEIELLIRNAECFEECLGAMPGLGNDYQQEVVVRTFKGISLDEVLLS